MGTEAVDDVDILLPDVKVTLSTGEKVTVREFSFREGNEANAFAWPLIVAFEQLFDGADIDDVAPHLVLQVFGRHADITMQLVALATGKPAEWLNALNDGDGQTLVHALYEANTRFFIRRLLEIRQAKSFATARS